MNAQPLEIEVVRKLAATMALGLLHGSEQDADTIFTALSRMWPQDGSLQRALASAIANTEFERAT
ncbi:hypothetical protein [Rhizobacter sp. SG703]|uniref:hypothetical protein n=1 Tax=Rhizobacter sp. SG703 TaxID=2587140 RepID=UPI001445BE30|nr:hypothetical protein [Rhizobacter sp. SG703]NKI93367.1 hypothetical protein [Rhizobacter sp. SG703]